MEEAGHELIGKHPRVRGGLVGLQRGGSPARGAVGSPLWITKPGTTRYQRSPVKNGLPSRGVSVPSARPTNEAHVSGVCS